MFCRQGGRSTGALLGLILAWSSIGVYGPRASANFATALDGPCDGNQARRCFADNSYHTWDRDLGPRNNDAVFRALYLSYDTTNLKVVHDQGHTPSVDIWFFTTSSLPNRTLAETSCINGNGTHRCDHWHVRFDVDNARFNDSQLRSIACHEIGHTVGLMHPE